MDKNAIKKYAIWARQELLARVAQKAAQYGITEKDFGNPDAEIVYGRILTPAEWQQRRALIYRIQSHGYQEVIDEVAYTWFNRFIAIRFMEVNEYLPSHIRVFTDEQNRFKPQILTEAIHLELRGLDMEKVYQLKSEDKTEELFKYLLITQCNALGDILPRMFSPIADYTELLLPDNLLREGSVIEQLVTVIPENDWKDQVQIIGWLYQHYNTELKNRVFANLKKNIKISKRDIPAATQLFTPDWIVRYMVENSLGRLWLNGHPNDALRESWKYYLDEAEQEPDVQTQLAAIRAQYAGLKPEDIRVIDPCMGSGHILCILFDVLFSIYKEYGYTTADAVKSIIENNLYGLDIDERAAQLAYFAVMMRARMYDKHFLTRRNEYGVLSIPQPHVMDIRESEPIDCNWEAFGPEKETARHLHALFADGKEYGSLLNVEATLEELAALRARLAEMDEMSDYGSLSTQAIVGQMLSVMLPLIDQSEILAQKYDVVVTNPPYMGSSGMNTKLVAYVKEDFPDGKNDLFSAFIERGLQMVKDDGFTSMITMESWMFLSSFEKLRIKTNQNNTIMALVHMPYLGKGGTSLGINFGTDMAVIAKRHIPAYIGTYDRIAYYETNDEGIPYEFPVKNKYYKQTTQDNFTKIPGTPMAYWVSERVPIIYSNYPILEEIADVRHGLSTGKNELFVRRWSEVDWRLVDTTLTDRLQIDQTHVKWFPYNKGGDYRKWYGNGEYVLWYDKNGQKKMSELSGHRHDGREKYFHEGITWSFISSSNFGVRYTPTGFVFDVAGSSMFLNDRKKMKYVLGLLCSRLGTYFMGIQNPTLNFQVGNLKNVPLIIEHENEVCIIADDCIKLSAVDWDSFETSWDFQRHPLLPRLPLDSETVFINRYGKIDSVTNRAVRLADCFADWQKECDERFAQLKANEEELNRIFIDIYGLQNELTPEVEDKDVTVRRADLGRDTRSLISYAVGCMFGRYSLYKPGLIFAGEPYSLTAFAHKMNDQPGTASERELIRACYNEGAIINEMFFPDPDNVLPICDDEYFEDDIVGKFIAFVSEAFGEDTLEENLKFIADALGGSGSPREVIRQYFLNGFYADHLKIYQKRPIYWLFDSGKKNGFKCLIYMHRYRPDTVARIRTDYVHEQQSRYRTAIADLEKRIAEAPTAERVRLTKRLTKLQAQAEETRLYEEKIHHLADQMIAIDLDDGVKVNYEKFKDVLAQIK